MKKIYLLALLLFSLKNLNAQVVFCPPGAEWNYNYFFLAIGNQSQQFTSLEKIKYSRDSLIAGNAVKILQHRVFYTTCEYRQNQNTLIRQSGDTVFFNNAQTFNTWQILYNFAATATQSWTSAVKEYYNSPIPTTYSVIVDSTKTIVENGINLKQLFVRYKAFLEGFWPLEYNRTITERFGNNELLFNYFNFAEGSCDADIYVRNLCYSDSSFGTKLFSDYPCDYSNPVGITENSPAEVSLSIFPNPGAEQIEIKLKTSTNHVNVKFTDVGGRLIKQSDLNVLAPIDIKDLQNGFYLIQVFSEDGTLLGKCKFLKSH